MKDNLNILENIKKVDAPPFLLTRIKQQIDNSNYRDEKFWIDQPDFTTYNFKELKEKSDLE